METKNSINDKKYYSVVLRKIDTREILVEAESYAQAEQRVWEMLDDDCYIEDDCESESSVEAYAEIPEELFKAFVGYGEPEEYEGKNGEKWKRRI